MSKSTPILHTLVLDLAKKCLHSNLKVAVAESCTGGMLASMLTTVAGSSMWFERGFVTYSNLAKQEMLGVSPITLAEYGAVSSETVIEMVAGVLKNSHAQLTVAISGIAGPGGGSIAKPVGTVWFGFAKQGFTKSEYKVFRGDRDEVRRQATFFAVQGLLDL